MFTLLNQHIAHSATGNHMCFDIATPRGIARTNVGLAKNDFRAVLFVNHELLGLSEGRI